MLKVLLVLLNIYGVFGEMSLRERLSQIKKVPKNGVVKAYISDSLPEYTDIFCEPAETVSKENCFFENVCYNLKTRYGLEIAEAGLRENFDSAKRKSILLNGCRDFVKVPSGQKKIKNFDEKEERIKALYIGNPVFMYSRFVANNLMHVLHDDILPLILNIANIEELRDIPEEEHRLLATFDDHNDLFFHDLYAWIGKFMNVNKVTDLVPMDDPKYHNLTHVCFKNAITGMSSSAQWYQYGALKPEGPLDGLDRDSVASNLRTVISWIKEEKLNLTTITGGENDKMIKSSSPPQFITLIVRKGNRLILNEIELKDSLKRTFPDYEVKVISEEFTPLLEMISTVHASKILIGVHGALLSLAMFLQPKSVLVELFPFGIPAEHYTPYKTLAGLPGIDIEYRAWMNPIEEAPANVFHDSRHRILGGLKHFPASYEAGIKATKTVPRHICCYSPIWKFRLYQDTRVDSDAVIELIHSAIDKK